MAVFILKNMSKKRTINNAEQAVAVARGLIMDQYKEHFIALYLGPRNQLNKRELISLGTLNACLVHPREVLRPAIISRSMSVIVLHNHPSFCTDPSEADLELTKRLKEAGQIIGIELADHIIFDADGDYKSII